MTRPLLRPLGRLLAMLLLSWGVEGFSRWLRQKLQ